MTAGYDQRFEELSETLRSASEALLAEQKAHLEATKKVRDAVARTGQAEAYGQDARNEESAYTKWRNVTIAFGVAAVTFLVALPILAEVFGWSGQLLETSVTSMVGRLAIAAAFGGLATWSGKQGAIHRRAERRSRNLEMGLLSLGSYLELIDDQKRRNAILEAFAVVFFTPPPPDNSDDSGPSLIDPAAVMRMITERATE